MNSGLSVQSTAFVQRQLAEAVLAQPANRFQWHALVYLLWKKNGKMDFADASEHALRQVLAAVQENEDVPSIGEIEQEICNCRALEWSLDDYFGGHKKHCRVLRFRKAIE